MMKLLNQSILSYIDGPSTTFQGLLIKKRVRPLTLMVKVQRRILERFVNGVHIPQALKGR